MVKLSHNLNVPLQTFIILPVQVGRVGLAFLVRMMVLLVLIQLHDPKSGKVEIYGIHLH
jgi:hypothetical protein